MIINDVFKSLNFNDYSIKLNNRKILSGITQVIGAQGREMDFTVAIDKLDKIGKDKVIEELESKGFKNKQLDFLRPIFDLSGNNSEKIDFLTEYLKESSIGKTGILELKEILDYTKQYRNSESNVEIDITLARGLSYYTGAIFEVKPTSVEMGSICGGGRYDNLTGVFGLSGVSGVGISFGVDRIYDVLSELQLYPIKSGSSVDVLVANFGGETLAASLEILNLIRERGLNAEIYPTTSKMKKQFNYADKKGIKNVLIIGDEELKHGLYGLKNMESGEQKKYDKESLLDALFTCR